MHRISRNKAPAVGQLYFGKQLNGSYHKRPQFGGHGKYKLSVTVPEFLTVISSAYFAYGFSHNLNIPPYAHIG